MVYSLFETLIRNIGGALGRKIRYHYYKKRLGACGKNVIIDIGVIITSPRNIFLGDDVWLDNYTVLIAGPFKKDRLYIEKVNEAYNFSAGELHIDSGVHLPPFVVLQAHAGIWIKKNAGFGAGAKVYSLSHHHSNLNNKNDQNQYALSSMAPKEEQFLISGPVVIGEKAAIGMNGVVLPGTHIPKGTWIGVNSYIQGNNITPHTLYSSPKAEITKTLGTE